MNILYVLRSLGMLLSIYSFALIPPMLVAIWYNENLIIPFSMSAIIIFLTGFTAWVPLRNYKHEPHIKDGFFIVVFLWVALCLAGTLPFLLIQTPDIKITDAVFESVSGLTATGATVLTTLDSMPKSLLYYRQQLQFLGGMGIILLAVAILPSLGAGGMQLMRAEISGPLKDARLTPRIAQTAKAIWLIYVLLTTICIIFYWAAGMELFDAIAYSFGTVSTGGFAPHVQSIGYFESPAIKIIAIVFMLFGAINYSLHYLTLKAGSIKHYWKDTESKSYIIWLLVAAAAITYCMMKYQRIEQLGSIFLDCLFHVVSLGTTTGFSSSEYYIWPNFIPFFLLLLGIVGGCSGSTSGGIKMIRALLLVKISLKELKMLVHPHAQYVIKFGSTPLQERTLFAIWAFISIYIILFTLLVLSLLATGLNFTTSFSAVAATLSNIGPGLGLAAENYQSINPIAKIILSCAMIAGRLEFFTLLVLFSPEYWRS